MNAILLLDAALLRRCAGLHRPPLTRLMRAVTRLGDASTWLLLLVFLAATGGDASGIAARLGLAIVIATVTSQALKRACRRPRPDSSLPGFSALAENPDAFSFPSGHTAVATAVAVALLGFGVALGPVALTLSICIAASRVYLGAHYPLDVIAGAAVGAACGIATRMLFTL
jgi:undecaprenyl-diphosphatase